MLGHSGSALLSLRLCTVIYPTVVSTRLPHPVFNYNGDFLIPMNLLRATGESINTINMNTV